MSDTPSNGIPFVPENTLDPAAGLNLALVVIDPLLQISVLTIGDTAPPGSPADGDRYIVGAGATGDWAGEDNKLAQYIADGAYWAFHTAYYVLNQADGRLYVFASGTWEVTDPRDLGAGTTANRPASPSLAGSTYFDTDLGLPIWWDGAGYVDATGTSV